MAGAVSDPFAYVGGGSSAVAPSIATKPVTGTPMQQAAQAAPRLDPVLQEAIEDPRNKTQLLRYEQEVQKFLRDQS
jgi:NifU-like protein involved in Fe-S cluster formation